MNNVKVKVFYLDTRTRAVRSTSFEATPEVVNAAVDELKKQKRLVAFAPLK